MPAGQRKSPCRRIAPSRIARACAASIVSWTLGVSRFPAASRSFGPPRRHAPALPPARLRRRTPRFDPVPSPTIRHPPARRADLGQLIGRQPGRRRRGFVRFPIRRFRKLFWFRGDRRGLRTVQRPAHAGQFALGVAEPVGGPEAEQAPAQPGEHLGAESVAVAPGRPRNTTGRRTPARAGNGRADRDRQSPGRCGSSASRRPGPPGSLRPSAEPPRPRRTARPRAPRRGLHHPALRERQELPQDRHTPRPAPRQVDVVGREVREDLAPHAGARDQDVQPALAALGVERAEAHRHVALGRRGRSRR